MAAILKKLKKPQSFDRFW